MRNGRTCKTVKSLPQSSQALSKLSPPVLLLVIGILLLAGGALFYVLGRNVPEQVAVQEPANIPAAVVESDIPYPEVARISVEEAKAQVDAGTAVLLDVRPLEDYETGHAANARSIPLAELPNRYPELSPDAAILTYCT